MHGGGVEMGTGERLWRPLLRGDGVQALKGLAPQVGSLPSVGIEPWPLKDTLKS